MSLSSYLQDKDIFSLAGSGDRAALKATILDKGKRWFSENGDEADTLRANIHALGFTPSDTLINAVQHHLLLHYYEKFIALVLKPADYCAYLQSSINMDSALSCIQHALSCGKAPFLAVCHFGAVELVPPVLAAQKLPLNAALRFATTGFADAARKTASLMAESGYFSPIRFIEIGVAAAALEMASAIRRGEILISIFDEITRYSIAVNLFGRKVRGGAGIDRIIKFSGSPVALMSTFMKRTGDDQYELIVHEIPPDAADPIQHLYNHLQLMLRESLEQWYFLHETIPFHEEVQP